jgi:hypothetical protein
MPTASEESSRVADVILRGGDFGRPMFAASATPADRIATLREGYAKAVAEAKKSRMDMEPVSGEDLQAPAKRIMNQPPVVVERVKKILGQ